MVKFPKPSLRKRRVRYDRAIRAMLDERPSARLSSRRPGSCAVSSRKRLPGGSHSPSRSKVPELFGLLDDRIPNSTYCRTILQSRSQSHTEETGEAPHEPIVVDPAPGRILPSRVSQVPWTDNTSKVLFLPPDHRPVLVVLSSGTCPLLTAKIPMANEVTENVAAQHHESPADLAFVAPRTNDLSVGSSVEPWRHHHDRNLDLLHNTPNASHSDAAIVINNNLPEAKRFEEGPSKSSTSLLGKRRSPPSEPEATDASQTRQKSGPVVSVEQQASALAVIPSPLSVGTTTGNTAAPVEPSNTTSGEAPPKSPSAITVLNPTQQQQPQTEEEEGGLKLLFAASLLQQTSGGTHNTNVTDSKSHNAHTPFPDLASTLPTVPVATSVSTPSNNGGAATVAVPTDHDVLCGRGGLINKHPGNVVYRKVVEYNKAVYKQVPKRHRILVPQSIVQTIRNSGGRFLQSTHTSWTEIPPHRAVQKTSQALREKPRGDEDEFELQEDDISAAGNQKNSSDSVGQHNSSDTYIDKNNSNEGSDNGGGWIVAT
jgi:hypothetical protein